MASSAEQGLYLGFDVGTQSTKGVVYDAASGRILAKASHRYGLIEGLEPGAAEQHPETWIGALREVARRLTGALDPARVIALGVSGQQHASVLLDEAGAVLRPAKLWCDTTTHREAERLSRTLGRSVPTGFTAPKLLWTKEHEPEAWQRVRRVLLPHDYVNLRLTGRATMEPGDASGTGLFDPETRRFDPKAIEAIDPRLGELLPPVGEAHEPAGRLSPEGAALLGLREGTLVSSGGGDNMMSAIGSGATRPGVVVVSLGTSGTVFCYSSHPVTDPAGAIAAFCDSTGGYLPLMCTMNVTGVTEEIRRAFESDLERLTGAAERVPAGSGGLLLLPYLQGERVPNLPHATGALLGIRPGLLRPDYLFRAALEGTTVALASGVERMKGLGIRLDSVRVVGGGANSPLWRQILADALDVEVTRPAEPESAAFGAALQALWQAHSTEGATLSADEVASERVALLATAERPRPNVVDVYRDYRARLDAMTARLFG